MLAYRRAAGAADVVHFQWLTVQPLDVHLLPRGRPLVLTAHDVLPREPRRGQLGAQRRLYERVDAVVVHSEHGRRRLVEALGIAPGSVHVIPHGAFMHLADVPGERPLPAELAAVGKPVVLCFGLMRPYKGIDVLLDAWRAAGVDAELWIVGLPRMEIAALRAAAPANVRWVPRFVPDSEVAAYFRRADLVVLPYREIDQSGVLFTALAFGAPLVLSAVGGFPEIAAEGAAALVAAGDPRRSPMSCNACSATPLHASRWRTAPARRRPAATPGTRSPRRTSSCVVAEAVAERRHAPTGTPRRPADAKCTGGRRPSAATQRRPEPSLSTRRPAHLPQCGIVLAWEIVFCSRALLVYAQIGYPLLLGAIARLRRDSSPQPRPRPRIRRR